MDNKIILNLAVSLDGYICDENGAFDWIKGHGDSSQDTGTQFKFEDFLASCDVIVMGRLAYDDLPEETFKSFSNKKIYVITREAKESEKENVEYITNNLVEKIVEVRDVEHKNIWLFGGGCSIDSFIKAKVIDEYILGIIPCILGKGRRLFLDNNPMIELSLKESGVIDGVAMLTYTNRK